MKKLLFILSLVFILSLLFSAAPAVNGYRARAAVVVDIDAAADVVTVEDGEGLLWEFYGVEDWEIGDVAALLMDDSGTPDYILDDAIISATYAGIL